MVELAKGGTPCYTLQAGASLAGMTGVVAAPVNLTVGGKNAEGWAVV